MRRVGVAALVAVVLLATSGGGSNGSYTVRAIFDDAGNIIPGENVKIGGVKVGTVGSVTATPQAKAAVILNISSSGFKDFRADASCTVRPQALIGEKFVNCLPTQPRVAAVLMGGVAFVAVRMAGWQGAGGDFQSESEFEEIVRHSETLAREGLAVDPDEAEFMELDPLNDEDFEELVRDALDDLPDLLRNALSHVAVVISDGGRRQRAYGLYQGDGATREDAHDRIVIFRDTLRRDFGHDPELLRDQVTSRAVEGAGAA